MMKNTFAMIVLLGLFACGEGPIDEEETNESLLSTTCNAQSEYACKKKSIGEYCVSRAGHGTCVVLSGTNTCGCR